MAVRLEENTLAGLRWLRVAGPRDQVFRALGEAAGDDIRALTSDLPEVEALVKLRARGGLASAVLDALLERNRTCHPHEFAEIVDLAAGAGVPAERLLLLNVRGDVGCTDDLGCSTLLWSGGGSFLAHNEDGDPAARDRFTFLTLHVDDEVSRTIQWYPGLLPANTFVVNAHGLAWGIDHLAVHRPAAAPGRQFVSRALQGAASVTEAVDYLTHHPTAGGYAYNFADVNNRRLLAVEAAAGRIEVRSVAAEDGLVWHTNHFRYLHPSGSDHPEGPSAEIPEVRTRRVETMRRGTVLEALAPPPREATGQWFLQTLADTAVPDGVFRNAVDGDPLMTHCTSVVDVERAEITLATRESAPVTLPLADYATGS